jgi:hypothetical protein
VQDSVPLATSLANYQTQANEAHACGYQVIYVTTFYTSQLPQNTGIVAVATSQYSAAIDQDARDGLIYSDMVIDTIQWLPDLTDQYIYSGNFVHPGPRGYSILARGMESCLRNHNCIGSYTGPAVFPTPTITTLNLTQVKYLANHTLLATEGIVRFNCSSCTLSLPSFGFNVGPIFLFNESYSTPFLLAAGTNGDVSNISHKTIEPQTGMVISVIQNGPTGVWEAEAENQRQFAPSLTPTAAPTASCAEQTFTVTGLVAGQFITTLNPPAFMGAHVWLNGYRASATNTLAIGFCGDATPGTPPSGTWNLTAY